MDRNGTVREMTQRRLQAAAAKMGEADKRQQAAGAAPERRLLQPDEQVNVQLLLKASRQQTREAMDQAAHYMAKFEEAKLVIEMLTNELAAKELKYADAMGQLIALQNQTGPPENRQGEAGEPPAGEQDAKGAGAA